MRSSVPAWFVALVHPEKTSVSVPISIHGKPRSLVITSIPNDEIAEIWDGIVTQLEVGSAVAVALFLITMMVVGRALAPLQALSQAMTKIEAGAYDARVEPGGAPELAAICTRLNHLAATLGEAVEEKRRLAERAVSLQDIERKEIARELHDEFGPYLFALRAHVGALMRLADAAEPDTERVAQAWRRHPRAGQRAAAAHPPDSGEAPARRARGARASRSVGRLAASVERIPPGCRHRDDDLGSLGETGETADLTIYRVVQEALTNVFRHAEATAVNVSIAPAERPAGSQDARGYALVRVCDNGRGLKPDHKFGLGLTGMRERLLALGGTLTVASGESGVTIEAMVPDWHAG